jgi:hypothetical protein
MIRYDLTCDKGHEFDSWFQSSAAFDHLAQAGHLSCATCGSAEVRKAVMAPRVVQKAEAVTAPTTAPEGEGTTQAVPALSGATSDVEKAIAELRRKVEANAEYVGTDFARQARDMHVGDAPERAIYGEARLDQAKALLEDGVPLMPLPFRLSKKLS